MASTNDNLLPSARLYEPMLITLSSNNTNIMNSRRRSSKTAQRTTTARPSNLNKCILKLLIFFLLMTIVLIALFSYSISLLFRSKQHEELAARQRQLATCTTVDCYKASNFILDYLNQSVSPCQNFYQFSCGSWIDRNSVEEDEDQERDQFSLAYEKVLKDIAAVLKEEPDELHDSPTVRNFKLFYKSCTSKDIIEFETDSSFLNFMREEFSEWPMLATSLQSDTTEEQHDDTDLEECLAKLTTLRMPLLFRFESDDYNHAKILFKILIPDDFCFLQKFLPNVNDDSRAKSSAAFFTLVKSIQSSMLDSLNISAPVSSQIDDQISAMLKLANSLYFLGNSQYKCGTKKTSAQVAIDQQQITLTIGELGKRVREGGNPSEAAFDFTKYIAYLNKHTGTDRLGDNTSVVISTLALNYLTDLLNALSMSQVDNRAQFHKSFLNFVYFHTLFSLIKPLDLFKTTNTLSQIVHVNVLLPIRYYHMFFEYSKHINNRTLLDNLINMFKLSREHNCAYSVIETFSVVDTPEQIELQRLFISRKLQPQAKAMADSMLASLVNTTYAMIERQAWIDETTRGEIRANLDNIEYKIVHADALFTDNLTHFADEEVNSDRYDAYKLSHVYLINMFQLKKMFYKKEIDLLGVEQVTRIRNKKYIFDIFLANLMYLKDFNTLLMPAGVVVEPIFNPNNPMYLNYATIGVYMSHEIWHAIHENLLETGDHKTRYSYLSKLDCLVTNYYEYTKKKYGLIIDGEISSSEQIADNFGILASFHTFIQLMSEQQKKNETAKSISGKEANDFKLMPGLAYDQQQLFFIRYAQGYCRKSKLYSVYDFQQYHVTNDFRAYQVSLIPEFFPVFKCQVKSGGGDSPIKPCKIFD
jgi:predicted metalloendopeptidase